MAKVKVTVVKRCNYNELFPENFPLKFVEGDPMLGPVCPAFEDGQEFIFDSDMVVPEGFCAWAFSDIQRDIMHLFMGGNCDSVNIPTAMLACCTDGFRPVIFKVERIED